MKQRRKAFTLRLSAESEAAIDDVMSCIEARERGIMRMPKTSRARTKVLNFIVAAACQAIVDSEDRGEPIIGEMDSDLLEELRRYGRDAYVLAFDARRQTREERELRVMLQELRAGESSET